MPAVIQISFVTIALVIFVSYLVVFWVKAVNEFIKAHKDAEAEVNVEDVANLGDN